MSPVEMKALLLDSDVREHIIGILKEVFRPEVPPPTKTIKSAKEAEK